MACPRAKSSQASSPLTRNAISMGVLWHLAHESRTSAGGKPSRGVTVRRGSPVTRQVAFFHAAGMLTPSASLDFAAPALSSAASASDNTL